MEGLGTHGMPYSAARSYDHLNPSAPPSAAAAAATYPPPPYDFDHGNHHQYHYPYHHTYPPPPHPPPVYAPAPASVATVHPDPEQHRIHTLFIAGLPDDVKPREIHNLFRRCRGFDSCQLEYTGRGNQVVAFATFFTHQSTMAALKELNGTTFDPQTGETLHIELARANSRKRPRGGYPYIVIDKRVKVKNEDEDEEASSSDGDDQPDESSGTDSDNSSKKDALAATKSKEAETNQSNTLTSENDDSKKPSSEEVPPCSTLFIANLGLSCTEEELKKELAKYSGFQALKMRGRRGMRVAFADFEDVESSTAAMNGFQGISLMSSDQGGLHIEYAKSKMRKS